MQRREKGTGTVYRRDNGTWVGRMNLGRGEDGKIKYKCVSGKSEAEVSGVLSPIRCKTLLDGGRRRTKNLYGVFKRIVPAGQVRQ